MFNNSYCILALIVQLIPFFNNPNNSVYTVLDFIGQ